MTNDTSYTTYFARRAPQVSFRKVDGVTVLALRATTARADDANDARARELRAIGAAARAQAERMDAADLVRLGTNMPRRLAGL